MIRLNEFICIRRQRRQTTSIDETQTESSNCFFFFLFPIANAKRGVLQTRKWGVAERVHNLWIQIDFNLIQSSHSITRTHTLRRGASEKWNHKLCGAYDARTASTLLHRIGPILNWFSLVFIKGKRRVVWCESGCIECRSSQAHDSRHMNINL